MKREHEPRPELRPAVPRDMLPAAELLQQTQDLAAIWPPEVANNPEFRCQVEERALLRERLDGVQSRLPRPDVSLEDAIGRGIVTEEQVADLYSSLGELLKDGSEYRRIALYLPFEFLPNASASFATDRLNDEAATFQREYMSAWSSLLNIHDVRANFVDGDVLEVDKRTGDLPRVVKAAHLLPKLIEKGWMTIEVLYDMLENNEDDTLLRSLADTIPALSDMGLLDEKKMARLSALGLPFVDEKIREAQTPKRERKQPTGLSLVALGQQLSERFIEVDAAQVGYEGMTDRRVAWLKGEKKRKAILTIGGILRDKLLAGHFADEERATIVQPETDAALQLAYIEGVRDALESTAKIDAAKAQSTYRGEHQVLTDLWQSDVLELRDALTRLYSRLHGFHVVSDDELKSLGIVVPALGGPFSRNLERMQDELRDIKVLVARMEQDEVLSASVYPVMLVFGSRVKGYGASNADIDVAVFMKPDADRAQKEELRARLQNDAVEFWLKEDGDRLQIDNRDAYDAHVGESHWTHMLFGAAWEGDQKTIQQLREKLLVTYFSDGENRGTYIEEMERDVLQYRLMHKGYERYFPSFGGIDVPHADSVDGKSMFWDSGYRQTATKLFASNVFLPKLSPTK